MRRLVQHVKVPIVEKSKQNQASLSPFERQSVNSDTQNGPQPHM